MQPQPHAIQGEGWSIWIGDQKIVRPSRNALYSILQDPTTVERWVRHDRIPKEAVELIDWKENGNSMKRLQQELEDGRQNMRLTSAGAGKRLLNGKSRTTTSVLGAMRAKTRIMCYSAMLRGRMTNGMNRC